MIDRVKSTAVKAKTTVQPGQYDVLCNRSSIAFNHIGNRRFRVIVENHASSYAETTGRSERSLMVHSIVKTIQGAGGRFLKKTTSSTWDETSNVKSREKVGHALRSAMSARKSEEERTMYGVIAAACEEDFEQQQSSIVKPSRNQTRSHCLIDAFTSGKDFPVVFEQKSLGSERSQDSVEYESSDLLESLFTMDLFPDSHINKDAINWRRRESANAMTSIFDELDALA